MRILQIFVATVLAMGLASPSFAQESSDPVGEYADYQVDTNRNRTTSYVRSGTIFAEVESFNAGDEATDPSYSSRIDYEFQIRWIGNRSGTSSMEIPAEFFTAEFKENLRATGHYESEQFKIDHLGYADARNLDGSFYPNCDVIRIYDIQQRSIEWMTALLAPAFYEESIEDMVIVAHVAEDVPVLGAVKIDMSGVYQGMDVKVGGDYFAP